MSAKSVGVVVAGSGCAGAMTAGSILLRSVALAGYYGLLSRLSGPQVRGGEAAALLRISSDPVDAQPDGFDLFCGIDWGSVERFAAEIPIDPAGAVLFDPKRGPIPQAILDSKARQIPVPFSALASAVSGGRSNMAAVGYLSAVLGVPLEPVIEAIRGQLSDKGKAAIAASEAVLRAAYETGMTSNLKYPLGRASQGAKRWLLSGNQAAAMGSLRGGVRFVAGYPITPATEFVEWLSPALGRLGGQFVQGAELVLAGGLFTPCFGWPSLGA